MTYKVFVQTRDGYCQLFATVATIGEASAKVKLAERYPMYMNAWYMRTD